VLTFSRKRFVQIFTSRAALRQSGHPAQDLAAGVAHAAQREPVAELGERWIGGRAYSVSRAIPETVLLP
jgi:hypothetical protein